MALSAFLRPLGIQRVVRPPEVSLDVNDVVLGDGLLHFSAIGSGRGEFDFGADLGGTDRSRYWEHVLTSRSLLQTTPRSVSSP